MNILITSAGRRVSLIRSFQRELKKVYPNAKVFASDSNPMLSAACQIADNFFEVPRLDESVYMNSLIEICKQNDISLIIPTIDTELYQLASHKSRFEESGITILVSSLEFIKKCRDKREIHKFFESKGVNVAMEYSKDNYQLPIFIKPIDGSRSIDTYIITNENEISNYHRSNEKLMFLEYINQNEFDEFTCDLYFSKSNELLCAVPRKRIEVRDGEVYKAVTKNNALVKYIRKHLNNIDGAAGCLTVQFFMHKEDITKIMGIEINPRFGGGFPLTYLAKGNFPKWIIEEYMLNKTIDYKFDIWESDLLMIRYDDEVLVHGYKD